MVGQPNPNCGGGVGIYFKVIGKLYFKITDIIGTWETELCISIQLEDFGYNSLYNFTGIVWLYIYNCNS